MKCLAYEIPELLIMTKLLKTSCALRSISKIIARGFSDGLFERQVDFSKGKLTFRKSKRRKCQINLNETVVST